MRDPAWAYLVPLPPPRPPRPANNEPVRTGEKWCGGCKAYHPRTAFQRNRSAPDGLQKTCREFTNARRRDYYRTHEQGQAARKRGEYWRDPDRGRAKGRESMQKTREQRRGK